MNDLEQQNRRNFLKTLIPACSIACLGGCGSRSPVPKSEPMHKFDKDWVLSYEDVFEKRFGYYITLMKQFENYLGREELLEMIKRAVDDSTLAEASEGKEFDFGEWIKGGQEYFANSMTWEVVELTDTVYEMKVSECLWYKIFKKYDATHIGYATICHGDFSSAKATHPNLRLERTKTIMSGDGYCDHRWILEKGAI